VIISSKVLFSGLQILLLQFIHVINSTATTPNLAGIHPLLARVQLTLVAFSLIQLGAI
jgi:hypothetical protein